MARVGLHDDGCGYGEVPGTVVTVLDDDRPCDLPAHLAPDPADPNQPAPTGMYWFTIKLRTRTGFDDDGTPLFGWTSLTRSISLLFEERTEFDAVAGMSLVKARLVVSYVGAHHITETCMAVRDDGVRYRVVGIDQYPDRLELDMRRIDQDDDAVVVTP